MKISKLTKIGYHQTMAVLPSTKTSKGRQLVRLFLLNVSEKSENFMVWYSNNFLLANPDKFQSLNINPRKLDKDKSDKTLSINDLDIANTELIKPL